MKIFFIITGIGYGHTIREQALIKEILKKHPKTQIKIATYKNSYEFFKKRYPTINIKGWNVPDKKFKFLIRKLIMANITAPINYPSNLLKLKKQIKKFKPDLIISDFEPVGISVSKSLKKKHLAIFNFDLRELKKYKKSRPFPINLVIQEKYVTDIYNNSQKNIITTLKGNTKKSKKYIYINPIIRSDPKTLPKEQTLMKKLELKKKPILIELGGTNFGVSILKEMIKILGDFKENFIIFHHGEGLKLPKNTKSISFKPNFLEYLKVSKAIITLSGHTTLSEALVFKKPALIYPVNNHLEQLLNAFTLEKIAKVKYLNKIKAKIFKNHLTEFLKDIPKIKKKLNSINVKGNGAEEIVKIIYGPARI